MDEGTYGLCQWPGEPIPFPRLQFIPWARYSIDVQEKIESGEIREAAGAW
jgi:RNA polymerase-binding transcription factor DksA